MRARYLILNMKNNVDGVIIVEGSNDASFISSLVNAHIFVTNGYDLSKEKIAFLKEVSKISRIIAMSDPDDAGECIRNRLKNEIDGVSTVLISSKSRKNYKKHGVAEATIKEVLEVLQPYFTSKPLFEEKYNLVSLISLSENPKVKREEIVKKYHLVNGNNKFLESQLKMLKITKEELWK